MAALSMILADGVTITVGGYVFNFGTNLIIYLIIAAIVGIIAYFIVGWGLLFGIVGAFIAGVVGFGLMTRVIHISALPVYAVVGVNVIRRLIGAIILVAVWHALPYLPWSRRSRYYRRS